MPRRVENRHLIAQGKDGALYAIFDSEGVKLELDQDGSIYGFQLSFVELDFLYNLYQGEQLLRCDRAFDVN